MKHLLIKNFFQIQAMLLVACSFASAAIPTITYHAKDQETETSAAISEFSTVEEYREYRKGIAAELKKIRQQNPKVKIRVFWSDLVPNGRFPSNKDNEGEPGGSVRQLAENIATDAGTDEVSGEVIKAEYTARSLTSKEERYVKRANTAAFWVRVRGIALYEAVHVYLMHSQHGLPKAIASGIAGAIILSRFVNFNTKNAEPIANLINYMKFKVYSEENGNLDELKKMIARVDGYTGTQKALYLGSVWFRSFLYELAYQGGIQLSLFGVFKFLDLPAEFKSVNFLLVVVLGSVGETIMSDLSVAEYQKTRIHTPHAIVEANVRIITTVASVLSTASTLISTDALNAAMVGVTAMSVGGLSMIYYFKNTSQIESYVSTFIKNIRTASSNLLNSACSLLMGSSQRRKMD